MTILPHKREGPRREKNRGKGDRNIADSAQPRNEGGRREGKKGTSNTFYLESAETQLKNNKM